MKKALIAFLFLTILAGISSAGTRLISSDPYTAVLECTMEAPVFGMDPEGRRTVYIKDCQTAVTPGYPSVLEYHLNLGVPEGARVRAQVLSVEFEDLQDFDLSPVPSLASSGQPGLGTYEYSKDPRLYGAPGFYPAEVAEALSTDRFRQYNTVRVKLSPVQYDPLGGILRLNKKITVKVSWDIGGKASASIPDRSLDPLYAKMMANYSQCRDWVLNASGAKAADPFDQYPVWFRISVLQEGIYRLDYEYLLRQGIDPSTIDPRTIKIFSGGSSALPKDRFTPVADTMRQIAIWVAGQDDGRFDEGDYVVFYGQDLSGWHKNARLTTPQFFNPYADTNRYWLTWGGAVGRRMSVRNCTPSGEVIPLAQSYTDTLHFEQNKFNPFNSGEFYYWATLRRNTTEDTRTYSFDLPTPGLASDKGKATIVLRAAIDSKHHLTWGLNGLAASDMYWIGSTGPPDRGSEPITSKERYDSVQLNNLADGRNSLTITLIKENADTTDAVYLNWIELVCSRKYQANNGSLKFRFDSTGLSRGRFQLGGFNSDSTMLLDVADPDAPDFLITGENYPAYIRFDDDWKPGNRYFASAASALLVPAGMREYLPNHLRTNYAEVRYLIISADQLWPQAQALLNYRRSKQWQQPVQAVKLSWIYNEFGFGLNDPAAIRNFLKYVFNSSGGKSPVWCVLLGGGNYDYRHIDRSIANSNLVPTHQEDVLNFVIEEYQLHSYDDWFAYYSTGQYPQVAIARMPAVNSDEAWTMVNKIINYESYKTYGPWRTRSLLVADDLTPDGSVYMSAAENLYNDTPGLYTVNKVYGVQYDLDLNKHKPDAQADVIKYWSEGAGIVNFIGHGAWWTWGHEWYFRDTDVPYLGNGEKLPFVITASCGISRFDNPYNKCINSLVVTKTAGGAIASFGSTRESSSNTLNYRLYDSLFDSLLDLGLAAMIAKKASNNPGNDQCYTLLGDPGLKFSLPGNPIELSVDDDTLYGGRRYHINGHVSAPSVFDGRVSVELRDIPRKNDDYGYLLPGNTVFKGEFPVINDSFAFTVYIPDELHISPEAGAKARAYAWNQNYDAAGATTGTIWIGGVDTIPDTTLSDKSGPKIEIFAGGMAVKEGDYLPDDARLRVQIADRNGINIAPGVLRRGEIKFTVLRDGQQISSQDISGDFVYSFSDDTMAVGSSSFSYNFENSGRYTLKIEAYDTKMNKGSYEVPVNVESAMNIYSVYNYPNPVKSDTYFTFMLSQPGDVSVRIFTVAGNLIKELKALGMNAGYQQLHWDGKDGRGDMPANGVYLYKISANGSSEEKSSFGKLVIMH